MDKCAFWHPPGTDFTNRVKESNAAAPMNNNWNTNFMTQPIPVWSQMPQTYFAPNTPQMTNQPIYSANIEPIISPRSSQNKPASNIDPLATNENSNNEEENMFTSQGDERSYDDMYNNVVSQSNENINELQKDKVPSTPKGPIITPTKINSSEKFSKMLV